MVAELENRSDFVVLLAPSPSMFGDARIRATCGSLALAVLAGAVRSTALRRLMSELDSVRVRVRVLGTVLVEARGCPRV